MKTKIHRIDCAGMTSSCGRLIFKKKSLMQRAIIVGMLLSGFGVFPAYGILGLWTWDGAGTDNLWTDTANWLPSTSSPATGAEVQFGGSNRLSPNNNNSSLEISEIDFLTGSSPFNLTGNAISLGGLAEIVNNSTSTQTVSMAVIQMAGSTISAVSGPLIVSKIDGAYSLKFSGSFPITLTGPVGGVIPPSNIIATGDVLVVDGGSVVTTGSQTYGPLTLGAAATFTAGGNIGFDQLVQANGNNLIVAATGDATFAGSVTDVAVLTVPSGTMSVSQGAKITAASAYITAALALSGEIEVSGGTLTFNGPVVINASGVINASNGNLVFNSSVVNNGVIVTRDCIPSITAIHVNETNVQVSFNTCSNLAYTVEYKTALAGATWTPLTSVTGTGSIMTVIDSGAAGLPQRFYRVVLVP